MTFLVKQVPGGLMSGWLNRAQSGETLDIKGPMGSFYLRTPTRPLLFLAGGTGLAPFLSMLEVLEKQAHALPIHLIYGVTRDQDLVMVDRLVNFPSPPVWQIRRQAMTSKDLSRNTCRQISCMTAISMCICAARPPWWMPYKNISKTLL
jgi:ferredoxin-NADP reductase